MKSVLLGEQRSHLSSDTGWLGGGIFKYLRLESYEDALNNIEFDKNAEQAGLKFEDYQPTYMLDWESKDSPARLGASMLAAPFSAKLKITQRQETRETAVDMAETFAYLLGLHVTTRRAYSDGEHRYLTYRGKIDHREVAVIWRDTAGWEQKDFERDKKFVAENKLAEGADEAFVNGGSLIPGARSLDAVFKGRMFASQ